MIDWILVAKIAGGGFGMTVLVLAILSVISWIVGLIVQKTTKATPEGKENSGKG